MNCKHCYDLLVHAPKSDAAVLVLTFTLTLFCGIVMSVYVGVMFSALMLMHRMADSSCVDRLTQQKNRHTDYDFSLVPAGIAVYTVSGPIFFGMTDKFYNAFLSVGNDDKIVILRMLDVPFIDTTGLENLQMGVLSLKKRGIKILLSEANAIVIQKLKRFRVIESSVINTADKSIVEVIDIARKMLND
jgi:SulP family sulfate permease